MISVFTPTYNREHTLFKLYESLQQQTDKSFEWVVVDDGSVDNTEKTVQSWVKSETSFSIIYKKVINGGKHLAINYGVQLAKGELFFIVDSDDYLTPNAIERMHFIARDLPKSEKFAGFAGTRISSTGSLIGSSFTSTSFVDATSLQRDKYNIKGDKSEVFFTDILKNFPFPAFENEKFLTESVAWYEIAHNGYKLRWVNEPFIVCAYLEDGLSYNFEKIKLKNPLGYLHFYKICFHYFHNIRRKFTALYYYYELAINIGRTKTEVLQDLKTSSLSLYIARLTKQIFGKR